MVCHMNTNLIRHKHATNMQQTFNKHATNIQQKFNKHSTNMQQTYNKHTTNIYIYILCIQIGRSPVTHTVL